MPRRIVSLVPSQTELLYHLGLDEEVIGITKFCVHPEKWFRKKERVGGTKTIDIEKIKSLKPDLVIANKEENLKEQVEELSGYVQVYVSDIKNLEDALQMIKDVGNLINREDEANKLVSQINEQFDHLKEFILSTNQQTDLSTNVHLNISTFQHINLKQQLNTAYLIWKNPYMAAGGDTFINDMMQRCGFNNIFKYIARYPEVNIEQSTLQPINNSTIQLLNNSTSKPFNPSSLQLLLLSSEPYPFKQKHIAELQQQLGGTRILLVDGEMFSWYGSRLSHAADYFIKLIKKIKEQD